MSYRLEWRPTALKRFADEWEQFPRPRREEVMDALDIMDKQLIDDPMLIGESRSIETLRIHFIPPIGIVFRVNPRLQLVEILSASIFQ